MTCLWSAGRWSVLRPDEIVANAPDILHEINKCLQDAQWSKIKEESVYVTDPLDRAALIGRVDQEISWAKQAVNVSLKTRLSTVRNRLIAAGYTRDFVVCAQDIFGELNACLQVFKRPEIKPEEVYRADQVDPRMLMHMLDEKIRLIKKNIVSVQADHAKSFASYLEVRKVQYAILVPWLASFNRYVQEAAQMHAVAQEGHNRFGDLQTPYSQEEVGIIASRVRWFSEPEQLRLSQYFDVCEPFSDAMLRSEHKFFRKLLQSYNRQAQVEVNEGAHEDLEHHAVDEVDRDMGLAVVAPTKEILAEGNSEIEDWDLVDLTEIGEADDPVLKVSIKKRSVSFSDIVAAYQMKNSAECMPTVMYQVLEYGLLSAWLVGLSVLGVAMITANLVAAAIPVFVLALAVPVIRTCSKQSNEQRTCFAMAARIAQACQREAVAPEVDFMPAAQHLVASTLVSDNAQGSQLSPVPANFA